MAIEPGQQLLHYRLIEKIGEGGMGVVWKAVDTTLDREVAIKILPDVFAQDPERLARFEREARLLASLSHPNIAVVHGLHEERGLRFLAMELVAGEDLASRLERGTLSLDEALSVARDVASALEAAHDNGVIHRDLKPANIQLMSGGGVKVLDFGLAKAIAPDPASGPSASSPTVTSAGTVAGVLLGTAAYMSPEQARAQEVDKRCDIWAFGCVLFEMLAGRAAFAGGTVSDTIAGILRGEPDWNRLPAETPRRVRDLLQRCLEKDARQRQRDIGDARIEIDRVVREKSSPRLAAPAVDASEPRSTRIPVAAALLCGLALGAAAWHFLGPTGPAREPLVTRLSITLPPDQELRDIDIAPDGRTVAYVSGDRSTDGETALYLRPLDSLEATRIPDSERASWARFSADGRRLAYGTLIDSPGKVEIKLLSLDGGPPVTLIRDADLAWMHPRWHGNDTLLFAREGNLVRMSTDGGEPEVLLDPDADGEPSVTFAASYLPDGKRLLVSLGHLADGRIQSRTELFSPDEGTRRVVVERGSAMSLTPTGHLLVRRDNTLFAIPFDPVAATRTGPEVPLMSGLEMFRLSRNGTSIYTDHSVQTVRLTLVDRSGRLENIEQFDTAIPEGGNPMDLRWSPDGRRLAVAVFEPETNRGRLWIYDPRRGAPAPLDFPGGFVINPIWSRDGAFVTFTAGSADSGWRMHRRAADGSGAPTALFEEDDPKARHLAEDVTRDGSLLVVTRVLENQVDLWALPEDGSPARPLIATPVGEADAKISPDGRWIAYESEASGAEEIWVSPMPTGVERPVEQRVRVSVDGGGYPRWSPDGTELLFLRGNNLMSAAVEFDGTGPLPTFGAPRLVLDLRALGLETPYDVNPQDGRFVFAYREGPERGSDEIHVVLDWVEELRRRTTE